MKKENKDNSVEIVEEQINQMPELKKRPVYIRTLNIFTSPMQRRYERYYKESKKHLLIDVIFVILILLLIATNIILLTRSFPIENVEIKINHSENKNTTTPVVKEKIVDTELILKSSVQYFNTDGDQLGFGAWPPSVDEITQVRVFVELKPSAHAVQDVNLKIKIAQSEMWQNDFVVDAGDALIFDAAQNLIYWRIDQLATGQSAQANFVMQVQPTAEDLNKKIKLVEWLSATAVDMLTKNAVEQTAGSLYSPAVK